MVTKLGKMVTYLEGLLFKQLAVLFGPRDRLIPFISTTAMLIATKPDRVVNYHEGLP